MNIRASSHMRRLMMVIGDIYTGWKKKSMGVIVDFFIYLLADFGISGI